MIQSKALEVNLADYHVDVTIKEEYAVLQEVMSGYFGIMEGLNHFLTELSHPYQNWKIIVKEARFYCMDYFYLMKPHPKGEEAARLFTEIFFQAFEAREGGPEIKSDAADNLLLFVQKIIRESREDLERFLPVINGVCLRTASFTDENFIFFVKSFYQLDRLADLLQKNARRYRKKDGKLNLTGVNELLVRYYRHTYNYWLKEENPAEWFEKEGSAAQLTLLKGYLEQISHKTFARLQKRLDDILENRESGKQSSIDITTELVGLPGYNRVVEIYREIPQRLLEAGDGNGKGHRWKVIFLFHIMKIPGLSLIYGDTLLDINRTVNRLILNEKPADIRRFIADTFSILKERYDDFPATALDCILNMGKAVYQTDDGDLINLFIDSAVSLGFQIPMIDGVGEDWQVKVNAVHIQNIRTWLELIRISPKWSKPLLSDLIIHLTLFGTFIKDTDLFPKDITHLLNSRIKPVYNPIKQLARLFPVYFNDIGAEGALRDISTEIDEITQRKDRLIHFLRKQIHVESSNRIIDFMEATLRFWEMGEKFILREHVAPDIYESIAETGIYLDGVRKIMRHLRKKGLTLPRALMELEENRLKKLLSDLPADVPRTDVTRLELAVKLYQLLYQKYDLAATFHLKEETDLYLAQLKNNAFPDIEKLRKAFSEKELNKKIFSLLDYLEELRGIILSPKSFEIREDIYKKRHITVDIPSMYGSYRELKFDALGLTLRIESLLNVYFEELIRQIDLSLVTKATFYQIFDILILFDKALKLDGISSDEIASQMDLLANSLEARGFTSTQYVDIFKGIARAVNNITNDYFHNFHQRNINRIVARMPKYRILKRYLPHTSEESENLELSISEIFFREKIAASLGIQQMDLLLSRILNTLHRQSANLKRDDLRLLLNYDPERATMSIYRQSSLTTGIIYLGNKGFNLVKLLNFGMPVPPGFIVTTEIFRCRRLLNNYEPARRNFREQIARHIKEMEKLTGKVFGDPENPLLFSVRSGSSISQPGMMDTFLDVGINAQIAAGMAKKTGNPWFAWDNYRRFLQCYGMSFGLERDAFDAIINKKKDELGIPLKRELTGDQMRDVALSYKELILSHEIEIEEDLFEQLLLTIYKVLDSWESDKALTYRKIMGISNDWGTAVTIQSMVYGNLSRESGTGVFFTHNPRWSGDLLRLWGDFTIGNQGEDVVSGLVNTLPISVIQRDAEMRDTDITLETHFPQIYEVLKEWARNLIYKKGWSPQEMEFTFEGPSRNNLYLLQTRNMTIRSQKKALRFAPEEITMDRTLGSGIGVSGGAMSGRMVFTLEEIDFWRKEEPDLQLILVRADTVPDDIREIYAADGLLTARGGVTSHASVVAHRLGKTCVVGCGNLVCLETEKLCRFGDLVLKSGDYISIDGQEGTIYKGSMKVEEK